MPNRLLVCDDEQIVLDAFSFVVEAAFMSRLVMTGARNGLEAIEKSRESTPDIVVMDMKMPGMGGIQALEHIRELAPRAVCVVLSAYDDFHYAREALRLGAIDYVLKPADRQRMTAMLEGALQTVQERDDRLRRATEVRNRLERLGPALAPALIYATMEYRDSPLELEALVPALGLDAGGRFASIRFPAERPEVAAFLVDEFRRMDGCHCGPVVIDRLPVFIMTGSPGAPDYRDPHWLLGRLAERFRDKTGLEFIAGLGDHSRDAESIYRSYRESVAALNEAATSGILTSEDLRPSGTDESDSLYELEYHLRREFFLGRRRSSLALVRCIFSRILALYGGKGQQARLLELELFLDRLIGDAGQATSSVLAAQSFKHDDDRELQAFRQVLERRVEEACLALQEERSRIRSRQVLDARAFMEARFSEDLSLDQIAAAAGASPGYLCRIFKAQEGETVLDFLAALRMERAKDLLRDPGRSVKEVAAEVGYRDPNYFSRLFRARSGSTVTDYREALAKDPLAGGGRA